MTNRENTKRARQKEYVKAFVRIVDETLHNRANPMIDADAKQSPNLNRQMIEGLKCQDTIEV